MVWLPASGARWQCLSCLETALWSRNGSRCEPERALCDTQWPAFRRAVSHHPVPVTSPVNRPLPRSRPQLRPCRQFSSPVPRPPSPIPHPPSPVPRPLSPIPVPVPSALSAHFTPPPPSEPCTRRSSAAQGWNSADDGGEINKYMLSQLMISSWAIHLCASATEWDGDSSCRCNNISPATEAINSLQLSECCRERVRVPIDGAPVNVRTFIQSHWTRGPEPEWLLHPIALVS